MTLKRLAVALAFLTAAWGVRAGTASQAVAAPAGPAYSSLPHPINTEAAPHVDPAADCRAATGIWSAEQTQDGLTPVKPRQNTEVGIWECRVGTHRLVVKHRADVRGYYQCSSTVIGNVSAWLDGVKVVRAEAIGDFEQCIGQPGRDITPIVLTITLDRAGKVTVCRLKGTARDAKKVCEIAPNGGRPDPVYYPPGYRTVPALQLRIDRSPVCRTLTSRLVFLPTGAPNDASLDAYAIPGTTDWGLLRREGASEPQALIDIDNDGRRDAVSLVRPMRMHGQEGGGIAWRPGGKAMTEPFEAGDLPDNDDVSWSTFTAFSVQPVTVAGRNYVYVRRRYIEDGPTQDLDLSADRPNLLTRGLLELHPDGKTTTVCGWGPKVRPEERL